MITKYVFNAPKEGKKFLVLAAIHGNEQAGTKACERLKKELTSGKIVLKSGRLTFVPICNPKAYEQDVRSIDENLNRVIKEHSHPKTYEQQLANEICPLIKDTDYLLDLHSTHCKGDVPFVFCDYPNELSQKVMASLPVDYVIEGWPEAYAGTTIQDYSTEYAAHYYSKAANTLECGYHKEPEAAEIAYQAIINTLAVLDMIEMADIPQFSKKIVKMQEYVIKAEEGKLTQNYKHLDAIRKGEVLAVYDNGQELTASYDGCILLPNANAAIGTEWYYLGKFK